MSIVLDGSLNAQIKNNFFGHRDRGGPSGQTNGWETIRIGNSGIMTQVLGAVIEGNYFDGAEGEEEVISDKTTDNFIRNNTFRDITKGRVTGRHGSGGIYEGNYFINIHPGAGHAPLLTGVNVPYSAEFRERESNLALITALVKAKPRGGESGKVVDNAWSRNPAEKKVDTFRGGLSPAISSQDVWPLFVVIMGCLFFADVLVRRYTDDPDQQARFAAVMGIVGFLDVPIVYYSVHWWRGHEAAER